MLTNAIERQKSPSSFNPAKVATGAAILKIGGKTVEFFKNADELRAANQRLIAAKLAKLEEGSSPLSKNQCLQISVALSVATLVYATIWVIKNF